MGELGSEWAGESNGGEDWTGELVYLLSVCKKGLVLVLVLDGLNVSRKELALP